MPAFGKGGQMRWLDGEYIGKQVDRGSGGSSGQGGGGSWSESESNGKSKGKGIGG